MIARIEGVPEELPPSQFFLRFLRINGDVMLFEYVTEQPLGGELVCTIQRS